MESIHDLIKILEKKALSPEKTIKESINETGKEVIGCFPIYTPEEIIYAAGYLPVGMWGGRTQIKLADKYLQGFCCSIMRANIELGLQGVYDFLKAVVLPTFCDTLKCVCENWKVAVPQVPILPIVYPQNRLLQSGFKYMVTEFTRIKGEIEKISGAKVSESDMEEAFKVYEEYRATMRTFVQVVKDYPITITARKRHLIIKAGYFMDKKRYTEVIRQIIDGLKGLPKEEWKGIRVITTGLIGEPVELLDIFDENCISIAADDFAQESRQFRVTARKEGTPLEKMAYRIVDQRGCTFLYEEQKCKGSMLINMVKENDAQAVIVCMMKFCDPEEFDFPIIKEEIESAEIPLLYIEIDQQMDSFEQIRTRVQSFAEMLS
ncbi:2-hydroxyacyl-CoA dehydratase subunit D [Sinanaerobacter chloroacetimidivorans]|nr:2-hydroxyacyl-CoA dehydratase family protein [Sinanaerobacter chloroacetimidivorans]